jgi:D-alanine--poly(phosphoribitol) ligase subunit 1
VALEPAVSDQIKLTSLVERVQHWSRVAPDSIAHESGGRALTYRELHRRSGSLARHLDESLGPMGKFVIVGHKEPEMLIGFLAGARSGHAYVPIDRSTPPGRVDRILEAVQHPLVLDPDSIASLSLARGRSRKHEINDVCPYYILFTSGSTGDPKGVIITHGGISAFVDWMLTGWDWREGEERVLNQAPFSFDLSVMDMSIALATGSTLVSLTAEEKANPRVLYERLEQSDLTVWVSTPSFAQLCLSERAFNANMLPRLRRFLFCGETLPPEVAAELLQRFPGAEVWNTYGPTEATVAVTSIKVTEEVIQRYPVLPVGFMMPTARLLIMSPSGAECPPGERGEIVIAGPNVALGYIGGDQTGKSFSRMDGQRAYHTGDWGRVIDGLLFFEGRRDEQIKLHGYRIEIGDIEANLRTLPDVRDAVVLPAEKDGRVESLTAFVVPINYARERDFRAARALQTALGERVPAYMVPRTIRFLESFPMNANGKADRGKLRELL